MVSIALVEKDRVIRVEDDVIFLHQLCDKFTYCAAHLLLAQINEGSNFSAEGRLQRNRSVSTNTAFWRSVLPPLGKPVTEGAQPDGG